MLRHLGVFVQAPMNFAEAIAPTTGTSQVNSNDFNANDTEPNP
jgi:hypothetical protein